MAARDAVGIADVARRAGVSASTVSRCLRGAGNVSTATRDRVLRAADELAYVPSPAASTLASGRTGTIGVIVPFASRWFFSEAVAGAEKVFRDAGYDLLLYNIGDVAARRRFFHVMPLRRRVDAVLTIATSLDDAERERVAGLGVPVTSAGGQFAGFRRVGIDDAAGAAMAARHLALLGHRDVVMVSGLPGDPVGNGTTAARRRGFCAALAAAGIEWRHERVIERPWGVAGGADAAAELLTRPTLPTAVFVECDETAFGVLHILRRARVAVPETVSVMGFDDHEMARATDLTTIAQPVGLQGELAARALLGTLEATDPDDELDTLLATSLVVRGTTGPPRA